MPQRNKLYQGLATDTVLDSTVGSVSLVWVFFICDLLILKNYKTLLELFFTPV